MAKTPDSLDSEEVIQGSPSARSATDTAQSVLIIACGALAPEILLLRKKNNWQHLALRCLPAILHNYPKRIPDEVRRVLSEEQPRGWGSIFVGYADCGTGGLLQPVLKEFGVESLPGTHCYGFFRGTELFDQEHEDNPFCFYLTDFLVRHFHSLMWRGLGLDKHPELLDTYFSNYQKLVYLSQLDIPSLRQQAQEIAKQLGLAYEERHTGLTPFAEALNPAFGDKHESQIKS